MSQEVQLPVHRAPSHSTQACVPVLTHHGRAQVRQCGLGDGLSGQEGESDPFDRVTALERRGLLRVPAKQVIEGCVPSRSRIDEGAVSHRGLRLLHPRLGRQLVGECLRCGRVALAADLDLVGGSAGVVRPAADGSHGRSTRRWSAITLGHLSRECPARTKRRWRARDGSNVRPLPSEGRITGHFGMSEDPSSIGKSSCTVPQSAPMIRTLVGHSGHGAPHRHR